MFVPTRYESPFDRRWRENTLQEIGWYAGLEILLFDAVSMTLEQLPEVNRARHLYDAGVATFDVESVADILSRIRLVG